MRILARMWRMAFRVMPIVLPVFRLRFRACLCLRLCLRLRLWRRLAWRQWLYQFGSRKWRRRRGAHALRRGLAIAEIRLRGLRVTAGQRQRDQQQAFRKLHACSFSRVRKTHCAVASTWQWICVLWAPVSQSREAAMLMPYRVQLWVTRATFGSAICHLFYTSGSKKSPTSCRDGGTQHAPKVWDHRYNFWNLERYITTYCLSIRTPRPRF